MKQFPIIYLFVLFFPGILSAQPLRRPVETGIVIVKLKPDAVPVFEKRLRTLRSNSSDTSTLNVGLKSIDRINRRYRASNMRRVFPDAGIYEAKHRKYGLHLWYEITIPEDEDPEAVAATYGLDGNIQLSEPRYKIRSLSMPAPPMPHAAAPNDPNFSRQWNYHNTGQTGGTPGADIRLLDAWETVSNMGVNNRNVIVAVVDDGVYYDHEDLKDNMWVNQAELNGVRGVDDDGNGYSDDIYGYNFVSLTRGAIAPESHGTHVAGTIAAVTGNETGVAGIAGNSGIKLMTTQIFNGDRGVRSFVEAYVYAADNGAVISQNSWGYVEAGDYNETDIEAINYFISEAGRDENGNPRPGTPMVGGIVIFAAGNDAQDAKWYPAYFDNVLAVAAVNHNGERASYSNYGSWVDISAPGGEGDSQITDNPGGIYSTSYNTINKNYYEHMWGTSMACPHVSGVAALILSVYGNENFTPDMLRTRLLCSATPLVGFDPANASGMGAGLLNAAAALAPESAPDPVTDLDAHAVGPVSCRLDWTMPPTGANGYYVAAYATEEITEDNFAQFAQSPVLFDADGERQLDTITGLIPSTTYYVAVRSVGFTCNLSGISNVQTFTTWDNKAPTVVNTLPDITLRDVAKEAAFYVGNIFSDSDGDAMTCEAATASSRIARVRINGDSLRILPLTAGMTTLSLTADDGNTGRCSLNLRLTITQNHAPAVNGLLADTSLIPHAPAVTIDLSEYIADPEGDAVSFTYQLSQTGIVDASIDGNILTIDPQYHGFTTLELTASDSYAAASTTPIDITVDQKYAPDKINQLLVYPNPSTDMVYCSFIMDEAASVMIRIVNTTGQIVYQVPATTNLPAGIHYYSVSLTDWGIGMYFLQYIRNGDVVDVKKFVKQ